ncbi:MAG: zinc ribbon domain-containing protein [Clostridiales bacterium]|nr:zinc ribbon domain-containing protein [Clostridiales bacterium]
MAFNVSFSNTIPFNDPKYRSIFIKIKGDLMVESDDPNYLVPGSETTVKYVADMANYSIGRTLINMGPVSYKELSTKFGEFVNVIASDLKSRQITLVGASFDPVEPDEASKIRIKRQEETERLVNDPAAMAAKMQEAQAQATAAAQAAPVQAAPVAAQAAAPASQAAPASSEPQLMKYCARCGTLASGSKFCTNCGSSLIKRS